MDDAGGGSVGFDPVGAVDGGCGCGTDRTLRLESTQVHLVLTSRAWLPTLGLVGAAARMLSPELNHYITRSGAGTPMGNHAVTGVAELR